MLVRLLLDVSSPSHVTTHLSKALCQLNMSSLLSDDDNTNNII